MLICVADSLFFETFFSWLLEDIFLSATQLGTPSCGGITLCALPLPLARTTGTQFSILHA